MFPHERSLVKKMEGKPFVLLGVNGDQPGKELIEQNKEAKITWRSFKNSKKNSDISEEWSVQGWPTLYLIDHNGIIQKKWIGSPGDAIIDKEVDKLVAKIEKEQAKK